jgi:hypothetical protein
MLENRPAAAGATAVRCCDRSRSLSMRASSPDPLSEMLYVIVSSGAGDALPATTTYVAPDAADSDTQSSDGGVPSTCTPPTGSDTVTGDAPDGQGAKPDF